MSAEKVNEYLVKELQKREVSEVMKNLQKEIYEKIVIKDAQINSLEDAIKGLDFVDFEVPAVKMKLDRLREELANNKASLTLRVEELINDTYKEDFVKVAKKTKFLQKELITHSTFSKINDHTIYTEHILNLLEETTNEELLHLSPHNIAALIQSEKKHSQINKFVNLFKPETNETKIDDWITKFSKHKNISEHQQIRVHFTEVKAMLQIGFSTKEMLQDIAIQWSVRLGLSGDHKNDSETQKAVKEAIEIMKEEAALII
ncbi:hypothetical protein [Priestia aryabhattai]